MTAGRGSRIRTLFVLHCVLVILELVQIVLDLGWWRRLASDPGRPVLKIGVPHRDVEVQGRRPQILDVLVRQGAPVDEIQCADSGHEQNADPEHGVQGGVEDESDAVAGARRSQEGQLEVGAALDPPAPERQSEVLVAGLDSPVSGGIEEAGETDRRVQEEAGQLGARPAYLGLDQAGSEADRKAEVREELVERSAARLGCDEAPARGDRSDRPAIGELVESEDAAVLRLEGVGMLRRGTAERRGDQQRREQGRDAAHSSTPKF
jgi:hypothetical protein